jgi:hypothetical protein
MSWGTGLFRHLTKEKLFKWRGQGNHASRCKRRKDDPMPYSIAKLGLALTVGLIVGAVIAQPAFAQQGKLTSDGPVLLDGVESGENYITGFGEKIECPGSTYKGEAIGGGFLSSGATEGTMVPSFNQSACRTGEHKVTVTMNGCDLVFKGGETISEGTYKGTGELHCPAGKAIVVDVYFASANENLKICTFEGGAQGGSGTGTLKNTEGSVEISGTVTGISASKSGVCGSGTTSSAEVHFAAKATGTNEAGGATSIVVSD